MNLQQLAQRITNQVNDVRSNAETLKALESLVKLTSICITGLPEVMAEMEAMQATITRQWAEIDRLRKRLGLAPDHLPDDPETLPMTPPAPESVPFPGTVSRTDMPDNFGEEIIVPGYTVHDGKIVT